MTAETILRYLIEFAALMTGFAVMWRTLSGKLKDENDKRELAAKQVEAQLEQDRKNQETKAAQIATASAKEANALILQSNLDAIQRLDQRNKDLDTANRERDIRIDAMQKTADERHKLDLAKDSQLSQLERQNQSLETKLEETAKTCKTEIERVLAELVLVNNKLEAALEGKGRADQRATTAQEAATTPVPLPAPAPVPPVVPTPAVSSETGQVAEGTVNISLEVKKKE